LGELNKVSFALSIGSIRLHNLSQSVSKQRILFVPLKMPPPAQCHPGCMPLSPPLPAATDNTNPIMYNYRQNYFLIFFSILIFPSTARLDIIFPAQSQTGKGELHRHPIIFNIYIYGELSLGVYRIVISTNLHNV